MFFSRLDQVCKENGTTVTAFLLSIGRSRSTATYLKSGKTPSSDIVLRASERFGVTANWLLGLPENTTTDSLDVREFELINSIRNTDPKTRDIIYRIIKAVTDVESLSPTKSVFFATNDEPFHPETSRIIYKRSEGKAAAGVPIEAVPEDDDAPVVRVPLKYTGSNYFVVEAQGDSMIGADIHSGDFCVFQADAHHDNGRIVLAQITDSETDQYTETIKRLYVLPDKVELRSENPAYPPLFYPRDEVQIAGVLVYISSANNAH